MWRSPSTAHPPSPVTRTTDAERLQKVIARSGLTSRRGADSLIVEGRVSVDGRVARPGQRVDPASAEVLVDGIRLPVDPELVYYLLHKPLGVISTTRDPGRRATVVELVPARPPVYPVGRLDADSTGLILLTNDGGFANLVTHPRYGIVKTYEVLVDGTPGRRALARLRRGVDLEDGPARAVSVRKIGSDGHRSHLEVSMGEGRNREVRRLCAAVGLAVVRLHRTSIGPVRDRALAPGAWRRLEVAEVRAFYRQGTRTTGRHSGREKR